MNKKPTENTSVGFFIIYQHFSKTEPIKLVYLQTVEVTKKWQRQISN